jgi:hypothetical protein
MCEEAIGCLPEFLFVSAASLGAFPQAARSSTHGIIARAPFGCHKRRYGTGWRLVHKAVFNKRRISHLCAAAQSNRNSKD